MLKVFGLAAEQGGITSFVICILFVNGRMNFYEVLKEVRMTPQYVNSVLKELKRNGMIEVNEFGYWFLTKWKTSRSFSTLDGSCTSLTLNRERR